MTFALCTICAGEESPGFYTGCMARDGHAPDWVCDGRGHLVRVREAVPLLTAPFGFGTGDSVTLRLEADELDENRLRHCLLGYSCYPPAVPKIVACLRASRRYDCVLQSGWFRRNYGRLLQDLNDLNITLRVTNPNPMDRSPFL